MSYDAIQDRIKAGEFENKLPYPTQVTLATNSEHVRLTKEIEKLHEKEGDLLAERKSILTDMRVAYDDESGELVKRFRAALEVEYGLENHPKRDKIWIKAWDEGRSSGFREVLNIYDDLVELVSIL